MAWYFISVLLASLPVFSQQQPRSANDALDTFQDGDSDSISYYLATTADDYLAKRAYDSARKYYHKARQHNQITGKQERLAENFNNLGVLYFHTGTWDSSIYYYDAAYREYQHLQDTAKLSILEINLGTLYKHKGLYEKSLEYLLAASYRLENSPPSTNLATSYNSIGNVYSKIGETLAALDFHYKALRVRQKLNLQVGISASYNNLGNVYLLLNQPDSALNNFQKSLKIKQDLNDKGGQGIVLNNIGELMIKTGKLEDAEQLLEKALSIRLETNESVGQVITRNNLAKVYLFKESLSAAERELKISEKLASSLGMLEQLKDNYEIQISLYKRTKDLDKALDYSQQLLVIKDSLLNQEKAQSLAEMQTRYESLKKEDRIALLEKEGLLQAVEIDRKQIWIRSLVLAVVSVLIIVVLVYYNLRTMRKNKIHIELLLKELHHRVKNNLQILSSLLSLQSQQLTDDTAIKAVKSSESRINAMALIHRKLYTVDQNRTVDIKEYITELIQYLVYSYGYHEKNLKLDLEINEISIDVDKAIPLGLILNELISNAFKHAYENQPNPRLMINLVHPDLHELNIRIRDNGRGMPVADDKQRKTFGMKIVTTLIKELKGSLNVKSENGTTYDLHIPI